MLRLGLFHVKRICNSYSVAPSASKPDSAAARSTSMPALYHAELKARARPVMSEAKREEKSRERPGRSSFSASSAATCSPSGARVEWANLRQASRTAAPSERALINSTGTPIAPRRHISASPRSWRNESGGDAPMRCGFQSACGAAPRPSPQPAELVSTSAVLPFRFAMSAWSFERLSSAASSSSSPAFPCGIGSTCPRVPALSSASADSVSDRRRAVRDADAMGDRPRQGADGST